MGQAQQHKSDKRYDDLNANSVLGGSKEVADFEGLFDPSEEEFDCPSPLVQVSNLLRTCAQVIGKDAQFLASLDNNPDFSHQPRHRILTRCGEPFRKMSDPIANDRRSSWNWPTFDNLKRRVDLQPCDDATAGTVQFRPPGKIVIAEVENVGRFRLNRHFFGGCNVI